MSGSNIVMFVPAPASLLLDIAGSEWIIIILLGLFLIFGTKKLPEFGKTIGKAVAEYEKARQSIRREIGFTSSQSPDASLQGILPRITGPVATEREKLESIANSLGIDHQGMTDEQIRYLISEKIR